MRRRHLVLATFLLAACASAPPKGKTRAPDGQWPAVMAGPGSAELSALVFVPGGMLAAGRSERGVAVLDRTVSAVPGPFVVLLDDVGRAQWSRSFETSGTASIEGAVVVGGPGIIVAGSFDGEIASDDRKVTSQGSDCFVARMDLEGNLSWMRSFGGAGHETCRGLALGADDTVWIAGSHTEAFDGLPATKGLGDAMVVQLDASSGEAKSSFTFGSGGDDHAHHVTAVGDDLIVTGNFGGRFDGSGKLLVPAEQAVLELAEELRLVPVGDYDGYVARFTVEGKPLWATAVSGPGYDLVTHAVPDAGGWLVSGVQQQSAPPNDTPGLASGIPLQGFVARLASDGALDWTWTDPLMAAVHEVAVVRDRIAVLGQHRDGFQIGTGRWRVVGETGVTLVLLDEKGQLVGGYGCDSPGDDHGVALATTPDGRIALAGTTTPGGGCARLPGSHRAGFVRLMVLDPQGELRPLMVE